MPPILPPVACDALAIASARPGGDATWGLMAFGGAALLKLAGSLALHMLTGCESAGIY